MEVKNKLNKLDGGGAFPAFVSYNVVPQPQPAAPYTSSQDTTQQESMIDDDLKKQLYTNSLPSDLQVWLGSTDVFSQDIFGNSVSIPRTSNQLKSLLYQAARMGFAKEQYNKAIQTVESNDGLQEMAVTTNGRIVVQDKDGNITQITAEELAENRDSYITLTNADLATLRATDSRLAFNDNVFTTISNGIGISKINKLITDVANRIGSDTRSNEYYRSPKDRKVKEGIDLLLQEAEDGTYKIKDYTKTQENQVKMALSYILASLPRNAKTVLMGKAAQLGLDPYNGALQLIQELVQSGVEDTREISIIGKASTTSSSSSDGKPKGIDFDLSQAIIAGGINPSYITIGTGTNFKYKVAANRFMSIKNKSGGESIGQSRMDTIINNSEISGILDKDNISVGNAMIDPIVLDKAAYMGDGVTVMELPYDIEFYNKTGKVRPDLDALNEIQEVERTIKENNITDKQKINDIYEEKGLPFKYDSLGNLNVQAYKKFAAFNTYIDESAFEDSILDLNKEYIREIESDSQKTTISGILNNKDTGFKIDDVYQGIMYIPVINDAINASIGSGNYMKAEYGDLNNAIAKEQQTERLNSYVNPSKSILQNE